MGEQNSNYTQCQLLLKGVVIHFASIVTSRFEMLLPKLYFALLL